MVNTIEQLQQEIYNLQVIQAKPNQSKPVTSAEPLQGFRQQIIPNRRRGGFRGQGCERAREALANHNN